MIHRIRVRLHDSEWESLRESAKAAGVSVNTYMRRALRSHSETTRTTWERS
ncbi:plasmid mobilization protein [Streptomyces sp. NPDC094154]|uniref:plasmid mobilization protein n=1 Tax=Streptomyces sp. NPDC094154 TaxID=3366059 RepID=UPI003803534E